MYIPVMIGAYFAGPYYGVLLSILTPLLSSLLTKMPPLYPNAVFIIADLSICTSVSSFMHRHFRYSLKLKHIYTSLISGIVAGKIIYILTGQLLLFIRPLKVTAIYLILNGIPGVLLQLLLIPAIIKLLGKSFSEYNAKSDAVKMVKSKEASSVVVRNNEIIDISKTKGISHILELYDKGLLEDAFISDVIIGKAAAMVFSAGKISSCYGYTISEEAIKFFDKMNIKYSYTEKTPVIQNRKGTGMCPMEETVQNVSDVKSAVNLLKEKLIMLKR